MRGVYTRLRVELPSVTPVASASITTGLAGTTAIHLDELVPPRRGALCRVRLVVRRDAHVQDREIALRHGLQHEPRAPEPCGADRVRDRRGRRFRAACTTYLIFRGRHRHAADEAGPYYAHREGGAVRGARSGGRPGSSTADLFARCKTETAARRSRIPASATATRAASAAHMVENDLFDFMLLSLPDSDTHSHRLTARMHRQARSSKAAMRSSA